MLVSTLWYKPHWSILFSTKYWQGNTLDLVLSNISETRVIADVSILDATDVYHHPPLGIKVIIPLRAERRIGSNNAQNLNGSLCYAKTDFEMIYNNIRSANWTPLYDI